MWANLLERVHLVVPSVILGEVDGYYDPVTGDYIPIHLRKEVEQGLITEVTATAEHLAVFMGRFDSTFAQRMDAGEREALALLHAGECAEHRFCTADGAAIPALCLLDMSEKGVSLETLLNEVGLSRTLPPKYREKFFVNMRAQGVEERIRGVGLRSSTSQPKGRKGRHPRRK